MWKPLDGTAEKTVKGVRQAPDLCVMVRAWPRQRRNSRPPIRSRTDQTTQAIRNAYCGLQPSSAVVSAVALWSRGHYLRTAFVLTWFKIKERQVSVYELLRNLKPFCRKGFTVL